MARKSNEFSYLDEEKRRGYVFTLHNMNPNAPYKAINDTGTRAVPICPPPGPPWWSRKSGRYRTSKEQREYITRGCVDIELPPIKLPSDE